MIEDAIVRADAVPTVYFRIKLLRSASHCVHVPIDVIRDWECLDTDTGEDLAVTVREYHILDFTEWKQEDAFETAFGELIRDLREEASEERA